MYRFSMDYQEDKKAHNKETFELKDELSFVLRTVIQTTRPEERYLVNYLINNFLKRRDADQVSGLRANFSIDKTHYSSGYSCIKIKSNHRESMRTKVFLFAEPYSAEDFIQKMANKWRVIFISATAKNDSIFSNFDLRWLKDNVKHMCINNPNDEKILNAENTFQREKYKKKVKVHLEKIKTKPVPGKSSYFQYFADLCSEKKTTEDLLSIYNEYLQAYSVQEDFGFFRDLDFFKAIIKMCRLNQSDPSLQSFITYRNTTTSEQQVEFISKLLKFVGLEKYSDCVKEISAKNDDQLAIIKRIWSKEQFCILITSFNSMDRGVNLQYPINEAFLKKYPMVINLDSAQKRKLEKDIDGTYLEAPTHLYHGFSSENIVKETLNVISEMESLSNHGDISRKKAKLNIEKYIVNHRIIEKLSAGMPALIAKEVILE